MTTSHIIVIDRTRIKFRLYVPSGTLLCYSGFATMSELAANVAHFLSQFPDTTVTYAGDPK